MLIAVSLRFIARRLSTMTFGYDDWLVIPAAVRPVFISYLPQHALLRLSGVSDLAMTVLQVTSSSKLTSTPTKQ